MIHLTTCTGLRRSGSTWSYNVARILMEGVASSRGLPCYANYHDGENIDGLLRHAAKSGSGFYVIKSHLPGRFAMNAIAAGKAWNLCTYRDPRDVVVSLHDFMDWSVEEAVEVIANEMAYMDAFWKMKTSLLLRYEDMTSDPTGQIAAIAEFLRVQVDDAAVERIHAQTSAEAHRKVSEGLAAEVVNEPADDEEAAVRREGDHLVHRVQLLHSGHIRDGASGKWRERLSAAEQQLACDRLGQAVRLMGYPKS